MREILFRGKTPNGRWTYGYYEDTDASSVDFTAIVPVRDSYCNLSYRVEPDTVGQYTGLKDKNGKRIFEGDIVRVITIRDGATSRCENGAIRFGFGSYDLQIGVKSSKPLVSDILDEIRISDVEYEMEIIGNIHDNPELLEVNEDANRPD